MKRPSFQFYPGDWRSSTSLSRCSHKLKGIWMDTLCLMHDADSYGLLPWPLEDIAQAVGCVVSDLRLLRDKGVLKGADIGEQCQTFIYTPRHAGKDGAPVTLIPAQPGPVWFSSRMVIDEYVRKVRGAATRYEATPKDIPEVTPKGGFGVELGYGSSTSSSSSSKKGRKKGDSEYAFEGRVIRLNQKDFDDMARNFSSFPDIRSELATIDAKFFDQGMTNDSKWFGQLTAWLRSQHEKNLQASKETKSSKKWTPMPSVAGG